MKYVVICLLSLICNISWAQNAVITQGGIDSFLIAKLVFSDSVVLAKPGGDGVISLSELDKHQDAVYIGQTSTMIIPFLFDTNKIDTSNNYRIIAALTRNTTILLTSIKNKDNTLEEIIKNKNGDIVLGGLGQNSVCSLVGKLIKKYYNTKVIYIGYKTTNQADIDLYNKELDIECKGGTKIDEGINSGISKPIANLSRTHTNYQIPNLKFSVPPSSNYLVVAKNTSEETVTKILEKVTEAKNNKTITDKFKRENSEFLGLTDEANKYYSEQKQSWFNIKKETD